MKLLVPALLVVAIAAAPSVARDRNPIPAATPAGPAVTCIPLRAIGESKVRSDSVIDFMTDRRRGYRVTLESPCPALSFEGAFSYQVSIGQLCAQDIITVIRQAGGPMPGASCGLAPFQPIELAPAPRAQPRH